MLKSALRGKSAAAFDASWLKPPGICAPSFPKAAPAASPLRLVIISRRLIVIVSLRLAITCILTQDEEYHNEVFRGVREIRHLDYPRTMIGRVVACRQRRNVLPAARSEHACDVEAHLESRSAS